MSGPFFSPEGKESRSLGAVYADTTTGGGLTKPGLYHLLRREKSFNLRAVYAQTPSRKTR